MEQMPNTAIAYFDLDMYVYCPKCNKRIELEEVDDEIYVNIFRMWINNDKDCFNRIKEEPIDCPRCNTSISIIDIER